MIQVIDASVAIKWFVDESGRDKALEVFSKLVVKPRTFAVPELFYFEISNIFNRLFPKPTTEQIQLINRVFNLGLQRFAMSKEFYKELSHFQKMGLSGYDAAYVALAKMTQGKWITFDEKAYKVVKNSGLAILL